METGIIFATMELLKKLRISIDQPLWLINEPDDCRDLFSGCDIKQKLAGSKPVGQLVFFALDGKTLAVQLPKLAPYISHDTVFWICYPKKTGAIASDLVLMKPWDVVFNSGFRGQTSVSVNDDWTGMRFTNAPRKTPSICDLPMEERKMEGIDFVNRTVQLPADAQAALNKYKGLAAFFDAMAFTHKREYVQAIAEAKKPETRVRRIEKMVEMLLQKMSDKSTKSKEKRPK